MGKQIPETVILKPPAFLEIILASAESYHEECYGILMGFKGESSILVEDAQVLQDVKKSPYHVTPIAKREKRILNLIKSLNLENMETIGDFHSHPMVAGVKGKPVPSGDDILDMEKGKLYIIVAVNETKRNIKWKYNPKKKILKGSLENFSFEISAYYCYEKLSYKKLHIKCPFVLNLKEE